MQNIYAPLDSRNGQIRLLDLFPAQFDDSLVVRLRTTSLHDGDVPAYEALSYSWGTGPSTAQVYIKDSHGPGLSITANLESALRHLRRLDQRRALWVDALCINQSDTTERGSQVQLMADIYTAASRVLIWLGPEDDSDGVRYYWSDLDGDLSEVMSSLDDSPTRTTHITNIGQTIDHVLARPWFERTWVVQEAALPSADPCLMVGYNIFRWHEFLINAGQLTMWLNLVPSIDATAFSRLASQDRGLSSIRRSFHQPNQRETGAFAYQLQRTMRRLATDPRDKIFGILAISVFESGKLLADYTKPLRQVCAEATALILSDRFLSIYFEFPLRPSRSNERHVAEGFSGWPSWIPNFAFACGTTYIGEDSLPPHDPLLSVPYEDFPMMLDTSFELRFERLSKCLPASLPPAHTTSDNTVLHAIGLPAGIIAATSTEALQTIDWAEPPWMSTNTVYNIYHEFLAPRHISPSDYLLVLVSEDHRQGWRTLRGDRKAEMEAFEHFLGASRQDRQAYDALFEAREYNEEGAALRLVDPMRKLAKAISLRSTGRIIFVTDTNLVGMSEHKEASAAIRSGDVLVGLFGVNFPFILRCNNDDLNTHSMIQNASVANHRWGHAFLGNTFDPWGVPPREDIQLFDTEVTWKDFEKFGLKEYTIV